MQPLFSTHISFFSPQKGLCGVTGRRPPTLQCTVFGRHSLAFRWPCCWSASSMRVPTRPSRHCQKVSVDRQIEPSLIIINTHTHHVALFPSIANHHHHPHHRPPLRVKWRTPQPEAPATSSPGPVRGDQPPPLWPLGDDDQLHIDPLVYTLRQRVSADIADSALYETHPRGSELNCVLCVLAWLLCAPASSSAPPHPQIPLTIPIRR